MRYHGTDKRKIDQRTDHFNGSSLNISVGHDVNKSFFEAVSIKQVEAWERLLMGQANFEVDFVEPFANMDYGEFLRGFIKHLSLIHI